MQNNLFRKLIFDEKIRSIVIQTLVIGFFALLVYSVSQTTAYNLEKRGIGTGFEFLGMSAGYDISFSMIEFTSKDTHLRAYYVGVINTLLVSVCGIFFSYNSRFFSWYYSSF
jgi:general L-amino acid transport system permease protein